MQFSPKVASFLLGLCMFFTGASGLVGEYILSTVSTYILGNSIEQFSITIALMLGMMGVGGWAQQFLRNAYLLEKLVLIEILLALLIGFAPSAIYAGFGFFPEHFKVIIYFFILSIGFLIGFEIPLIIRINEHFAQTLKANLSTVISADYMGSLVGAMLWVYFLLPSFSIMQSSFIVSALNLVIAMIAMLYFGYFLKLKYKLVILGAFLLVGMSLLYGYNKALVWDSYLEQKLYDDKIVLSQTSKYQHIVMTHNQNLDEYRLYINGNVQFSSLDEALYHELLVHPAYALVSDVKDVLILGGGDGLALRELNKYKDIRSITLVDLDPEMVKLASSNDILKKLNHNAFADARVVSENFKALQDDIKISQKEGFVNPFMQNEEYDYNVSLFHLDADTFLAELEGKKFDLIYIDLPDPSSVELAKLYSKEFYKKVRNHLNEYGMIAIQATSPYHAKEAYLCIGRTLQASGLKTLAYHQNIPSFGDWGWYLAWRNSTTKEAMKEHLYQIKDFNVSTKFLTTELLQTTPIFAKDALVSRSGTINTLMQPKLLEIYQKNSWLYY